MITRETLQVLEFDKILKVASRFAHSDVSKKSVLGLLPLHRREDIEKRFGQVTEIRRLIQGGLLLKFAHFQDISPVLEQVRPEDAVLEPRELLNLVPVLRIISEISCQTRERRELSFLNELTGHLTGFPGLLAAIESSLDGEGNVLDGASPVLFSLRTRIRTLEAVIRKQLQETVRDRRITPFLQDDFVTKRAGRWVVPVRMDSKGQVPGVVHDVSRSGETAFMEPLEIIGIANELENLVAEGRAEEIRILRGICQMIREVAAPLGIQFESLVYLDVLNSIAQFADFLRMDVPEINNLAQIRLINARHPLLVLSQREGFGEAVPLDLSLGGDSTIMVITGPNAGGKTVAIKTVGLLLVMALSGIPIPADSCSTLPLANRLLLDIGDEQSIENSLSTFSAHISNITQIMKEADPETVILMDELGTGTDPLEGAAIACAVLRDLRQKGALVLATTHLTEIVGFAYQTAGMINTSMDFDRETLTPLYRLRVGEPGQSHALEIARKYGLPDAIIDFARQMLGDAKVEFYDLLAELKQKRLSYEVALDAVQKQRMDWEERERRWEQRLAEMENQKLAVMERVYGEAKDIISETKREMYALLEEAKREKSRAVLRKVVKVQQQVEEKLRQFQGPSLSMDEIREGNTVFVRSVGYDATVLRVDRRHKRLKVKAGTMDLEVPLGDVGPKRGRSPVTTVTPEREAEREPVSSQLNLIGLRVDDALSVLEPFLNHASLAGLKEVTVIHGLGTGALLRAVRDHLTGHPLVEQFRSGELPEGGNGVTIVTLK